MSRASYFFIIFILSAQLFAQQNKSMDSYISTIFEAELREYNRQAGHPMTLEKAKQHADIFFRAITQFSGANPGDYSQLKAGFEVAMVSANAGTPIVYNREARSVYDALCHGKANCAAGTDLYLAGAIKAWGGDQIRKQHLAVIFSKGHVQPGYFSQNASGGWDLYRVETTATNVSPQDLGRTTALANHGPLRVLLVEDYVKMEANRLAGIPNERIITEMLPQALDRVAQYGVPVRELEALIQSVPFRNSGALQSAHATPLAFGVSAVPPGDRERQPYPGGSINGEWWPESANSNASNSTSSSNPSTSTPQRLPTERDYEVLNRVRLLEEKIGSIDFNRFQPWIYDSIDHRRRIMAHPWVKAAIQQEPSLKHKIEDFYDTELAAFIKRESAPYDGGIMVYEPEVYNFQLRLGRNFNGEVVNGQHLNNHSAYSYIGRASSNYDYKNEARFILDLIANPNTWENYLKISSQVQDGVNAEPQNPVAGEVWVLPLVAQPKNKKNKNLMDLRNNADSDTKPLRP